MNDIHLSLTIDDFHEWIRALRVGLCRYDSLFDKLAIFEHRLVGGPSSDITNPLKKSTTNNNPFLHWIVRIDDVKEQLGELVDLIDDYNKFWALLSEIEKSILSNLITRKISMTLLSANLDISRTYLYQVRNELYQKWVTFNKSKK